MYGLINYDQLASLLGTVIRHLGVPPNRLILPLTDFGMILVADQHAVGSRRSKKTLAFRELVESFCAKCRFETLGSDFSRTRGFWVMLVAVCEVLKPGEWPLDQAEAVAVDMRAAVYAALDKGSAGAGRGEEEASAQGVTPPAVKKPPQLAPATDPSAI
jgi:hypothetical protein